MTLPVAFPPERLVSAAGIPDSLAPVIAFNNDQLLPAHAELSALLGVHAPATGPRTAAERAAHERAAEIAGYRDTAVTFFGAVRMLHEVVRFIEDNLPASDRPALASLSRATESLWTSVRDHGHPAEPLRFTHPTHWAELSASAQRACDLLTSPARAAAIAELMEDASVDESLRVDVMEVVGQTVLALGDLVGQTQRCTDLNDGLLAALGRWEEGSSAAQTVWDALLTGANVMGATFGDMPGGADGIALAMLKLPCVMAAMRGRSDWQRLTRLLARAAGHGDQSSELIRALEAREYTRARRIVEGGGRGGPWLSAGLTALGVLQLIAAIEGVLDPDPDPWQEYLNVGTGALTTAASAVVTIDRVAVHIGHAHATLEALGRFASGNAVNSLAGVLGIITGGFDLAQGIAEGDTLRMTLGGLEISSGLCVTAGALAAMVLAEEAAFAVAAVTGPAGTFFALLGLVVAALMSGEEAESPEPAVLLQHIIDQIRAYDARSEPAPPSAYPRSEEPMDAGLPGGSEPRFRSILSVLDSRLHHNFAGLLANVESALRATSVPHARIPAASREAAWRRLRAIGIDGETTGYVMIVSRVGAPPVMAH
jgi:hypothetical protein